MKVKKITVALFTAIVGLFMTALPVLAHAVVKPNQVGVAAFQTFTLGVPNEKDMPTVSVKLMIPEGLGHVSPNVKPGWKIEVKKNGEGEDARVTEIIWTGGSIPAGQRDEFVFSAQAPASETTLTWKAYQTYAGGNVVSWDQDPSEMKEMSHEDQDKMVEEGKGPFSATKIVNDLANAPSEDSHGMQKDSKSTGDTDTAKVLSIIALALSIVALGMQFKEKRD